MWLVRTKTDEVVGFTIPWTETEITRFRKTVPSFEELKERCKPMRDEYGVFDGWSSRFVQDDAAIYLTAELHSKFLYLTYEDEPIWADFFEPFNDDIKENSFEK